MKLLRAFNKKFSMSPLACMILKPGLYLTIWSHAGDHFKLAVTFWRGQFHLKWPFFKLGVTCYYSELIWLRKVSLVNILFLITYRLHALILNEECCDFTLFWYSVSMTHSSDFIFLLEGTYPFVPRYGLAKWMKPLQNLFSSGHSCLNWVTNIKRFFLLIGSKLLFAQIETIGLSSTTFS